jgi:protein-tyrosine phosphatase
MNGTDSPSFVDIHCHILPGIDDGARDSTEAITMARLAVGSGIRSIVTTPHHLPRSALTAAEEGRRRVMNLQRTVDEMKLALSLYPGQENPIHPDLIERFQEGEMLSLNETRYILVEPPFTRYPAHVEHALQTLQEMGLTPIMAHPERNAQVQEDPEIVRRLVKRGVLMQVNTGSFLGHYGEKSRKSASILLRRNLAHILATDAHHPFGNRVPNMAAGFEAVAREAGEERAWAMARDNPLAVKEGRPVPELWDPLEAPAPVLDSKFTLSWGRQGRLV